MNMDDDMIIRMVEYDFHVALQHGKNQDANKNFTLKFPNSVIMYPGTNDSVSDSLSCTIIFPDGFKHTYSVPVIKIQTYSMEEIRKKHLTLFIPFLLLRFRERLDSKKSPIQPNELTEFTNELIVSLEEEVQIGNITTTEFRDYVGLINHAAERIFHEKTEYQEEVLNVTKSIIQLPSDIIEELKVELLEKDNTIAEKDNTIADLNKENEELRKKLASLTN